MKKFMFFSIFFIISNNIFTAQTFNGSNQATIDIEVTVNVIAPPQQLMIADENGNQRDSIILNHTIPSTFEGENTENGTFYVQRGTGENAQNLEAGVLDISLQKNEATLAGPKIAINSRFNLQDSSIPVADGTNRIRNMISSTISKTPGAQLAPNEIYNTSNTMTVIWNKEGFN